MADLGVSTSRTGTLTVNSTTLSNAIRDNTGEV